MQKGDIKKARKVNQFINVFTEQYIKEPSYKPVVKEGLKLLIKIFNKI
jgi:CRISPR/Cas system Type II protein with McrA/HNH and RuvC-like nuclease domain